MLLVNKEIVFFDLDGVLWNIKNDDIWIIDKDKPYKPVLILDPLEFQLIQSGQFKKDDLKLDYNGKIFYISKDLFEKIKKKSGSHNIERFGISFIPQVRKEILDKREIDILTHNIEHLRYNKFIDIVNKHIIGYNRTWHLKKHYMQRKKQSVYPSEKPICLLFI